MFLERSIQPVFERYSKNFPVVLLEGPRQVGKSTFLEKLSQKSRTYITLDDPRLLNLAKEDPSGFFQTFKPPILIDEVQYAPELFPYIKMLADQQKVPGQFWLTGSQSLSLLKKASESLAGRVGILRLSGLSQKEWQQQPSTSVPWHQQEIPAQVEPFNLFESIYRGSFPALLNKNLLPEDFFSSYLQTYILRDIRMTAQIGDEQKFFLFLRACAARTGNILNYSDLARDCSISVNTAKSWVNLLIGFGLIYLLEPFSTNLTKRLIKSPKLYFLDTGLAAWLTAWPDANTLEAGAMSGAIYETYVVAEILKSYWNAGLRAPLSFFKDRRDREIDLLIETAGGLIPVEIKKTASPTTKDCQNFSILDELHQNILPGFVICQSQWHIPLGSNHQSWPAFAL